jgi:hypothetical protein
MERSAVKTDSSQNVSAWIERGAPEPLICMVVFSNQMSSEAVQIRPFGAALFNGSANRLSSCQSSSLCWLRPGGAADG